MGSRRIGSRILLHKCLCTEAISSAPLPKPLSREKLLYQKLSAVSHQNVPDQDLAHIFNEWSLSGKPLKRFEVIRCVKTFRNRQDYRLALKLIRWMETSGLGVNDSERALEIDLLCMTGGLESAEKCYEKLEQSLKTTKTLGALFGCYCREKKLDKALELFEKIKKLGFVSTLSYNNLFNLYIKVGQPQMVPSLVEEMEQTSIAPDLYTYNLLINSYAAMKDLDAMEGVLAKMKLKEMKIDWFTYENLARLFIDSGRLDKACSILEEIESKKHLHNVEAFQTMISIYARTGNLPAIYRSWGSLKLTCPTPSNKSYLIMLLALFKMGELESIEKYCEEWEAGCSSYDVRVSNVLLESYLKRGMIEEANKVYERSRKRGKEPNVKGCELLTNVYIKKGEINQALKYLLVGSKMAIPVVHKWFPTDETIKIFLEYFRKGNDTENAKIFLECMKRVDRLDFAVFESLVGQSSPQAE